MSPMLQLFCVSVVLCVCVARLFCYCFVCLLLCVCLMYCFVVCLFCLCVVCFYFVMDACVVSLLLFGCLWFALVLCLFLLFVFVLMFFYAVCFWLSLFDVLCARAVWFVCFLFACFACSACLLCLGVLFANCLGSTQLGHNFTHDAVPSDSSLVRWMLNDLVPFKLCSTCCRHLVWPTFVLGLASHGWLRDCFKLCLF